jgi:NADP-dependent 3-hydroxy acid dehydrogenase YdfG
MKITGKNVFITGASAGIGEACARIFAEAGANLILTARRFDRIEKLAKELTEKFNIKVHKIELDVRNFSEVEKAISNLPKEFENVDILINNAGKALGIEKIQDGILEKWEEMIDTNIKGLLYVSRQIIPKMLKRNEGTIINIGSIAGHEVYPGGNVYCATKYAVNALSKGMKLDLHGTNIRVSSIDPGAVNTEFSLVRFAGDSEKAENVYKGFNPLVAADIAEIALFIASRPPHVDIHDVIVTSTAQSCATMISKK